MVAAGAGTRRRPVGFARFGPECVEAALTAQGRGLMVVDPAEVDDDVVGDVTEILTSLCARLYGHRAAANRARWLDVEPTVRPAHAGRWP